MSAADTIGRLLSQLIPPGVQLVTTPTRDGGVAIALVAGAGLDVEYLSVTRVTAAQLASRDHGRWVDDLHREVTRAVLAFCEYPERVCK